MDETTSFKSEATPDLVPLLAGRKNLALRGHATQSTSSEYPQFYASLANDGNRNTNIYAKSCSTTDKQFYPWWRVDLLDEYLIGRVVITNRGDCCSGRINGAEIRIGNSLDNNGDNNPRCAVISLLPSLSFTYTYNMTGRYVNVVIPAKDAILTLCEVKVYRAPDNQTRA
ncbi:fucolectin-like [Salminus brasiliensis]|uniref:fucolectin-like n=1 Tax=Salminus brasiliensis TaxID=930266 RepID=UPI003B8375AE